MAHPAQMPMPNVGLYFQGDDRSHLVQNQNALSPKELSKVIRSGTRPQDLVEAINKTETVTNEHLYDALDREVDLSVFEALVNKIKEIGESVVTSALYQDRIEELHVLLNSKKTPPSAPETLFDKAKSRKMRECLVSFYPELQSKLDRYPTPVVSLPVQQEEKKILGYWDVLLRKDEISDKLKNQAVSSAQERNFVSARFSWDAIPNEATRNKVEVELFGICFGFGDREALECILKIAMTHQNHDRRDDSLRTFIDECQKLQNNKAAKELSVEALGAIRQPHLQSKYRKQLGLN